MVRSEGDSYRPLYGADLGPPPPLTATARAAMYHFQGNGNYGNNNQPAGRSDGRPRNGPSRPPRRFHFRAPPPPPSERPLFTQAHLQESSEPTFGGDGAEDKFRNLDDLTDTDETDMEESIDEDHEENNDTEGPPSKRSRINDQGDAAAMGPKWSNPDPYTALPPIDSDSRKKTNVVHLIRKARNTAAVEQKDATASHDDDFISFDLDDDEGVNVSTAPPDAPLGPRLGRHDFIPSNVPSALGKRTRDEFENAPLVTPKYGQQYHSDGRVLQIWRADADDDATPWVENTRSSAESAGAALHKEIIDFYEWVQPRDYEIAVRGDLLARLEQALVRLHPGGKLKAFGSYAAGLYLPVGDMDLVYLERKFNSNAASGGPPLKPTRRLFETTANFIRGQGIARPGSVNAIWFAKVPIIKFIENVSGLKVDLSFNNSTGVIANETFQRWREVYPAMPIITSIIKQFVMIRGLNDVASGGLGGFSVICLVTSLLQHMPQTGQPANLGQTLVEFFNLYGKLFNRQQIAIRLDPPGYLDVANYRPFEFNNDKPDRLKIIDPNRPENNISGGTNKIGLIFDCFATAHDILQATLAAHEVGHVVSSFLELIVGGNFEAYDTQREYLRELHIGPRGLKAPAVLPPSPPKENRQPQHQFTPPPPPPMYQAQVPVRTRTSVSSNEARPASVSLVDAVNQYDFTPTMTVELNQTIKRLQLLRPSLAERAQVATNMQQLAGIGGYAHVHVMMQDLDTRARTSNVLTGKSGATLRSAQYIHPTFTDPEGERLEWIRMRMRRFRPDLAAAIDACTSKAHIGAACGYGDNGKLFSTLADWETKNGLSQGIKQQADAFKAAITNANEEKKAQTAKAKKQRKKARSKNKASN